MNKKTNCIGPRSLSDLGSTPIEMKPISASKWESSSTDKRLDAAHHYKEGSKADEAADRKARADINHEAKGGR